MIKFKNISYYYDKSSGVKDLKNINLEVGCGECIVLCGESGCGKTTLIRLINGLIPHFHNGVLEGEVTINGSQMNSLEMHDIARQIGSVFQNPRSQFFNSETRGELAFCCENLGIPVNEINKRVDHVVDSMSIKHLEGRTLFKLSGGEKQKIACASVSVLDPDIIVMDEPSSNLDMNGIKDLTNSIARWKREGKTVIIAEHRLHFLSELADRYIYMSGGKILRELSLNELLDSSIAELRASNIQSILTSPLPEPNVEKDNKIKFTQFTYSYDRSDQVLNIMNLELPTNRIIAIVGPNGAGKSTFAATLSGFIKNKGKVKYNGIVFNWKKRLKSFYMVKQDVNHQLFTESVLEEVLLSMKIENRDYANKLLDDFDLTGLSQRHPMSLSGGQKQRVAITSAVASNREVILFDEPTSGLDLKHMLNIGQNMIKLIEKGKSLFVITHDIEFILKYCNHIVHIEDGLVTNNFRLENKSRSKLIDIFFNHNS